MALEASLLSWADDIEAEDKQRPSPLLTGLESRQPCVKQEDAKRDFFISYNRNDRQWAEWIAWTLEEAGYSTVIQAWDFRPGGNFVLEMQKAATGTQRTIAVLSENYLNAEYTQSEWAAAFARDPQGKERTLIPVRVAECMPTGLLATLTYVDLVGLPEGDARIALLGAFSERGKPTHAPSFPGSASTPSAVSSERVAPEQKVYPGETHEPSIANSLDLAEQTSVEVGQKTMSPDERVLLMRKLNSIASQQFNMLVFAVNPPPGLIPPMPAPQADRSNALLTWAESDGGCGLAKVAEVLHKVQVP